MILSYVSDDRDHHDDRDRGRRDHANGRGHDHGHDPNGGHAPNGRDLRPSSLQNTGRLHGVAQPSGLQGMAAATNNLRATCSAFRPDTSSPRSIQNPAQELAGAHELREAAVADRC
jgi:hypothetical protein